MATYLLGEATEAAPLLPDQASRVGRREWLPGFALGRRSDLLKGGYDGLRLCS